MKTAEAQRGGVLGATVFAAAGMVLLVGLGIWQLERKAWKDDLVGQMSVRLAAAPQPLPSPQQWASLDQAQDEFRRVAFTGVFSGGEALIYTAGSSFRPDVQGAGYWVFAPVRLAEGSVLLVDRGFVPLERKNVARPTPLPGSVDMVGVMRWPEKRGTFTPADEPQNNVWYVRDPVQIAAIKNWNAPAPFYVELESPQSPGGWPRAGKVVVELPNNHLQYALTWFGIAAGLAGVYLVWLRAQRQRD